VKIISILLTSLLIGSACTPPGSDNPSPSEALSVPVIEPATRTFSHPDLPGFRFEYPDDWMVEIKAFSDEQPQGFEGDYFSTCGSGCMGVRLKEEDVSLEMVFEVSLDNNTGPACSNTAEFHALQNGWYRISSRGNGLYYSRLVDEGVDTAQDSNVSSLSFGSSADEWSYLPETKYAFCEIAGSRLFLRAAPSSEIAEEGRILLGKPRVTGEPTSEVIEKLDAVVGTIEW